MMTTEYLAEETPETLRLQANSLRFLANLFVAPLNGMQLDQAHVFLTTLGYDPGEETAEEIRADFVSLFVGLRKTLAPPWESVYVSRERRVFQEPTLAVRRAYLEAGLHHNKMFEAPDDHISLELEFVACLDERLAVALESGSLDQVSELGRRKQCFVEDHLARWIGMFATDILAHATTEFWKGVALTLRTFFPPAGSAQESAVKGG